MQRNQDSSMLHAVQSRCRIVTAEHMPDGHGRQSTKGMSLAVRMLVLLESRPTRESEVVEDSTPRSRTADNSEAHVTLAHLCRPTHTQTPTRTQNASAETIKGSEI